jgi:2-amino-4-hydroxy-6-hydroxymethyldihydropteridine diphosphokinase
MPARRALLGLGSNVGDRDGNIRRALGLLERCGAVRIVSESTLRTTAPVGGPLQNDFRNAAALVETPLDARTLLDHLKRVEREVGREPGGERWGPRVIDVDLLLLADDVVDDPDLCVPHPRMAERRFVLEPAVEIAPAMRHPILDRTVRELWEDLA